MKRWKPQTQHPFSQNNLTAPWHRRPKAARLYILHPNNIGRCSHIANASFAVSSTHRGNHIGEALVRDCLHHAKALGFHILQFNAVVASNHGAQHLYEKLNFVQLGRIPGGFFNIRGEYEDIIVYYHTLCEE